MRLYDYFRSSAAFRVRITLHLKGIAYEQVPIHLLKEGGIQHQAHYHAINAQELIPALVLDSGETLTQSIAIIEYLEAIHPSPSLLPTDLIQKAKVRAIANMVACDIHPLNNLRVLQYMKNNLHMTEDQKNAWYQHWIQTGFRAIEEMLPQHDDSFAFGESPTLADVCLVPQIYNAIRFKCETNNFPKLQRIYENAFAHPAISRAFPENQPDAE
ncbi:MAG: maleylacetoacetate isomerase [Gammaproteobacteria bacterium]